MKNTLFTLILALVILPVSAHEGHHHGEEEEETSLVSNHALTGTWVTKQKKKAILTLNLCGNGDTLVGRVEQIKLIDAPKKLNVESASISDVGDVPEEGNGFTEYTILLNSLRDSDVAVTMIARTDDVAGQLSVNFADQEEETTYTAKRKKAKASPACLKLLNAHDDEADE